MNGVELMDSGVIENFLMWMYWNFLWICKKREYRERNEGKNMTPRLKSQYEKDVKKS